MYLAPLNSDYFFRKIFSDLVNLSILSRTVLFLALGALLLGASYLYQRFKERE